MSDAAISVWNLTKRYGNLVAVDGISFEVNKGDAFGFLGPNGAGKTTTIKAILGIIGIDGGIVKINGIDISDKSSKKSVGYLPEKVSFYDNLTALQNLYFYAKLKGCTKEECKNLLEEMGLGNVMRKKVKGFSKGMLQRLGIARAILGVPSILILDEPSIGLDPEGVFLVRKKLKDLNKNGCTIFLSSHLLGEVQSVCSKVSIINKGRVIAKGEIKDLIRKLEMKPKLVINLEAFPEDILEEIKKLRGIYGVKLERNLLEVICEPEAKIDVLVFLTKSGLKVKDFQTVAPSLEEIFMMFIREEA